MTNQIELLKSFGFSGMEANVYLELLKATAITGYRVAQAMGKPVSNVYKAPESLVRKGAVAVMSQDQSKLYSALPIDDFLAAREANFMSRSNLLSRALQTPREASTSNDTLRLENAGQILVQARRMVQFIQPRGP